MTLGLLPYPATSMNAHVTGFAQEDLAPRGHRTDHALNTDVLIGAAYRQLFFHTMAADREPFLESQFRNGQINVQQLMRGLCLSERFQRGYIGATPTTTWQPTWCSAFSAVK